MLRTCPVGLGNAVMNAFITGSPEPLGLDTTVGGYMTESHPNERTHCVNGR